MAFDKEFAEQMFRGMVRGMDREQLKLLQDIVAERQTELAGLEKSEDATYYDPTVIGAAHRAAMRRSQPVNGRSGSAEIWVDGSYDPATGRYAYGMAVEKENGERELYAKAFPKDASSSMRNVAGELAGATQAIRYAEDKKLAELVVHHDYTGIGDWADGNWKANKPETQAYKALAQSARLHGLNLRFEHVKGHSGEELNEKCDELAKNILGLARSKDPEVCAAGPYISKHEQNAKVQNAIGLAPGKAGQPGFKDLSL